MAAIRKLDESAQGVIAATGMVTVSIPVPRQERWHVNRYAVITNQAPTLTTMPIATLYNNSVSDGNVIDSTYTGARDSGDGDIWLEGGSQLICQWTGGIAGTTATLSIFGEREAT